MKLNMINCILLVLLLLVFMVLRKCTNSPLVIHFLNFVRLLAINLIFNHNPNLNITRKVLKKRFLFTTSQTRFIFDSNFYNQIDGVAMGSPFLLSLLTFSGLFTNLSGFMNIILTDLDFFRFSGW